MRALSVCVLLCSALVLANAAKSGPVMLSEWLERQTAAPSTTAKSASAPAHYEEADYEWGCFKSTEPRTCRCIGCADVCNNEGNEGSCGDEINFAPTCCQTQFFSVGPWRKPFFVLGLSFLGGGWGGARIHGKGGQRAA